MFQSKRNLLAVAMASLLSFSYAFAQEPTEKKKLKIQLLSAGKVIPPNRTLTKTDTDIQVKVFAYEGKLQHELVATDIAVNLIRHGKKIANQIFYGGGSIANLASLAKNEDTFLFEIKEIYEKNPDGSLKAYSKGVAKFSYLFYDANFSN